MRKKIVFSFLSLLFFFGKAQINNELKSELHKTLTESEVKILTNADKHYKNQEFIAALNLYDSLAKAHPDNLYLKYLLGTCQCYNTFYFAKAEENIKAAESIKNKLPDYDFYLGRVYENNDKYEDAIKQFELYLKNPLPDTLVGVVKHQIEICRSSAEQLSKGTIANITNIGPPINTAAS